MDRWSKARMGMKTMSVVVVLLMVVAGCSGDSDVGETFSEIGSDLGGDGGLTGAATATTSAASERGVAQEDSSGEGAPEEPDVEGEGGDDDALGNGGITPVALPTDIGRDIIFTAEMTVAVTDVAGAGEDATRQIEQLGGFLFGQRTTGAPDPTSVLTFKVQPGDFQAALAALGSIGEIRSQDVGANDVTERIVDLESRIQTATASVDRLRVLLSEATDIEAVVELESELLARETELETLRGSLRTIQDQVALATIVLTLTEAASHPELALSLTAYTAHDSGMSCPGDVEVQIETSSDATVCFEIVNTGDTWLADFELRDPVLDVELDDLIVVFGDPARALEPGDTLILATEVTPERDLRTQTTVTAQPVDEEGTEIAGRPTSRTETVFVNAVDPGGIPTFTEGLQASWDLLVRVGQSLVLVVGALLPFFWVPLIGWLVWRMRRPARAERH